MTTKPYNISKIRRALDMAFDDSMFSDFCFDYFPDVYDRFSRGSRKDEKIHLLLDYCRRRPNGLQLLLEAVRQEYQMSYPSREELKPIIDALEADRRHFDHSSTTKTSNVKSSSNPQETVSFAARNKTLSFAERAEIVQHLLTIPSIADASKRMTVIEQLSPEIKTNIAYSSAYRVHIFNIVETCLQYPGGMQELIEIIQFFEGNSVPMLQLEQTLNRLLPRGSDRKNEPSPLKVELSSNIKEGSRSEGIGNEDAHDSQSKPDPDSQLTISSKGESTMQLSSVNSLLSEITSSLGGTEQLQLDRLTNMTTKIHSLLNLPVNDFKSGEWHNELCVFSLNIAPVVTEVNLFKKIPLIYYQGAELTERAIDELRVVMINQPISNRLAALVLLGVDEVSADIQKVVNSRIRDVYAYDLIILGKKNLKKLLSAPEPLPALRKLILSQVNLITISPFVTQGATPDKMFFGREKELREITEHIATTSYIVAGGRRVGKTSLLKRLARVRLPTAGFRTFYHDCALTPNQDKLKKPLLFHQNWSPKPLFDRPISFLDIVQSLADDSQWLDKGNKQPDQAAFQGLLDDKPLVILLDEVDKLIQFDRVAGYPIFSILRALHNAGRCRFVFSGEQALLAEFTDANSPFYNFAKDMLIGRLNFPSVKELVTQPMKDLEVELVDERAMVQRIWEFTSGHPNVVQCLCQRFIIRLNKRRNRCLTLHDVEAVVADPEFLQKDFLNIYWERATVLERLCSLVMAANDGVGTLMSIHQMLKSLGLKVRLKQVNNALQRLVDLRNILQSTAEGYAFAVTAFPEVIAKTTRLNDLIALDCETYEFNGDVVPD